MKTAVVIPTYKRPLLLEQLLDSLAQCAFPPRLDIYVVENGVRSDTEDVCKASPIGNRVRYLYSAIAGKTPAVNLAIRASDADFFIFFDDDVKVSTGIIETYVEAAQRYGPGNFFGGPLLIDAEAPCPPHLVPYLPPSATGWAFANRETEIRPSEFVFFFGANWGAFRSDLRKSGLFSEHLGPSPAKYAPIGGETELQRRLIKASVRAIYLPSAVIRHHVGKECYTKKWLWYRHFRHGLYDYALYRSDGQETQEIFGIPLWVIRSFAKQELKVVASRLLRFPIERRTRIQMRQAYLTGWLYGTFTRRKT
jgi:succinoglycan biosynthesis protein ExoM